MLNIRIIMRRERICEYFTNLTECVLIFIKVVDALKERSAHADGMNY